MTEAHDFRLLGRSDIEHLRGKLERGLAAWSTKWFQATVETKLMETRVGAPESEVQWYAASATPIDACIGFASPSALPLLDHWLLGESPISTTRPNIDEEWCKAFVLDLLHEFLATLNESTAGSLAGRGTFQAVALPKLYTSPTSGSLLAKIESAGQSFWVALAPFQIKQLLRDRPGSPIKSHIAKAPASEALTSAAVRLSVGAWIDESLTIEALHGLRVGDVLVLGRKVDEPWPVVAPNGSTVAHCYLGRQGDQQAIKLVTPSKDPLRHAN